MSTPDPSIPVAERTSNPDPITGAPGSHPAGTAVGAAGAGVVGTAIGMAVAGPVGAVVGAAVGGVAGGLAGKAVAETIDPTAEEAYWREAHKNESYYNKDLTYDDDYAPAYRVGYTRYDGSRDFDTAQTDLERDYQESRGTSKLEWDEAQHAARAAWRRAEERRQEKLAGERPLA